MEKLGAASVPYISLTRHAETSILNPTLHLRTWVTLALVEGCSAGGGVVREILLESDSAARSY
jgi:hypothetical protein